MNFVGVFGSHETIWFSITKYLVGQPESQESILKAFVGPWYQIFVHLMSLIVGAMNFEIYRNLKFL